MLSIVVLTTSAVLLAGWGAFARGADGFDRCLGGAKQGLVEQWISCEIRP